MYAKWWDTLAYVPYRRYDTTTELKLLNEIYAVARLYRNFFQPAIKLREKTRVGGRIKRIYDKAQTPYERLLASGQIPKSKQQQLRAQYQALNPAELRRQLEELCQRLEEVSHAKGDVVHKPAARGPAITISGWRGRKRRMR